jgi:hypothetical protein
VPGDELGGDAVQPGPGLTARGFVSASRGDEKDLGRQVV